MKMKRLIFLIALSTIFLSGISAQQKQKRFTRERFQAELEQYITKKACLTPNEASKFFPLYNEMKSKQQALHGEMKSLKRIKPTSDSECKKNILKRDEFEIEIKNIQKTYHEKFMKILSAKKVYDILKAEDRFHRQMFKRTANRNRNKKKD